MAGVIGRALVQVYADLSTFDKDAKKKLQESLDETYKGVNFDELNERSERAGREAADEVGKGMDKESPGRLRKSGEKAGQSFKEGFTKVLGGLMVAAFPALIAVAVEAAAYLAPLAAALGATIPAAISVLLGSVATLTLAFHGVGQAVKDSFDPTKVAQFNAEMKKLTPGAQGFVKEIQRLHPLLTQLQRDVQQVFFNQLEGDVTLLGRTLIPTLRKGLVGMSVDLGKILDSLARGVAGQKNNIAQIFIDADKALRPFIPLVGQLAGTFITLAAAAGPFLDFMSAGLARVLGQFTTFVATSAKSGGLAGFFAGAQSVLSNVAGLLGQVGTLIGNIVAALGSSGGQAFGIVGQLIAELNTFLATAAGKQDLASIFMLLNTVLQSLSDVITPLLPVIGELARAFADDLGAAIKMVTPYLVKIADFMRDHPALVKAVVEAYVAYRIAMVALTAVQIAFDAAAAANPIGLVTIAIALYVAWIVVLVTHYKLILGWIKEVWNWLGRFFSDLWNWVKGVGSSIANWFTVTLPGFFTSLPGKIWDALKALPGILKSAILDVLGFIGFEIGLFVGLVVAWFTKMPGLIWNALKDFAGFLRGIFVQAWDWVTTVVSTGVDKAVAFFKALPGRALAELRALPGQLRSLMTQAWNWVVDAVENGGNRVIAFAKALPGRLAGFFKGVGTTILGGLKEGINAVIGGFNRGIDSVSSKIHIGLPHIPMLASGGLISSPTLAVVGEAGPEAVVPLNNPGQALAVAQQTGLLGMLGSALGRGQGAPIVHVYIGNKEITEIVDVRVEHQLGQQANALSYGARS